MTKVLFFNKTQIFEGINIRFIMLLLDGVAKPYFQL